MLVERVSLVGWPAQNRSRSDCTRARSREMKKLPTLGRWLMASLLVVVGVQHFLYAKFVSTLVPEWISFRLFWAYFVGVAFFAAAIALTLNLVARLAGALLGV